MDIASSNKAMWRGALILSLLLGIAALIVSTILQGLSGLFGSALATFTVVIFFSVSLLVSRLTKDADPVKTMALALFSYFTKLLLVAGFLVIVTRYTSENTFDRTSFGLSAIVIVIGWLAGEVRAFFKLRLQLPLPETSSTELEDN